jgi:hypothetical protein
MMHGPEKSAPIIVARKPTNEAGRPVEEPVERSDCNRSRSRS